MFFDVKKTRRYTLEPQSVAEFKKRVADYINKEDGVTSLSADHISDEIVETALYDVILNSFQGDEECYAASFNDYDSSISLDFDEGEIEDAIYEAAALVRDYPDGIIEGEETDDQPVSKHFLVINDWANGDSSGVVILYIAHSYDEALSAFNERLPQEKESSEDSGYDDYEEREGYFDSWLKHGFYGDGHNKLYIQEVNNNVE